MTTKTNEKLPTVAQATQELDQAKAKLEEVRSAVVAGSTKVGPPDIADARAAVEYAELRLELAGASDEHRAEVARQARIAEIVESFTSGAIAQKGRQVVDAERKAVEAFTALLEAAGGYHADSSAAYGELERLGPLPEGVSVERGTGATVHGATFAARSGSWVGNVVRGAIWRSLKPRIGAMDDTTRKLFNSLSSALAGGIHDEKRTMAEQLAASLERVKKGTSDG